MSALSPGPERTYIRFIVCDLVGTTKPVLAVGANDHLYVVKFQHNPSGAESLAAELISSQLGLLMNLPMAMPAIIDVNHHLCQDPELAKRDAASYNSRLHYGSRVFGESTSGACSYAPKEMLRHLCGLDALLGALVLDGWIANRASRREVIFIGTNEQLRPGPRTKLRNGTYSPILIDHHLGLSDWKQSDRTPQGIIAIADPWLYPCSPDVGSCEAWIVAAKSIPLRTLEAIVATVPEQWRLSDDYRSRVLSMLVDRQRKLQDIVHSTCRRQLGLKTNPRTVRRQCKSTAQLRQQEAS
jgi:hypothetical protein